MAPGEGIKRTDKINSRARKGGGRKRQAKAEKLELILRKRVGGEIRNTVSEREA